jgi:hypothetical protein
MAQKLILPRLNIPLISKGSAAKNLFGKGNPILKIRIEDITD